MPGGLDRALHRLGTRIGEEARVGEGVVDQALTEPLLLGNGEGVGSVPDFFGRRLQRRHHVRVAVTQRVDRHAGVKIEVGRAVLREQSHALAPLKSEVGPGIRTVQRRHLRTPFMGSIRDCCKSPTKTKNALRKCGALQALHMPLWST